VIDKRERYLVSVLQGRIAQFGDDIIPAEFRGEKPIDLSSEAVKYEVKALMLKLGKNLPLFRSLMSGHNKFVETFNNNVNQVLVDIAVLEKQKELNAKRSATAKDVR
jgi:hypothetical protein